MFSPRAALSAKSAIRRLRVLTVTTMRQTMRASVRQSRGFVYVSEGERWTMNPAVEPSACDHTLGAVAVPPASLVPATLC